MTTKTSLLNLTSPGQHGGRTADVCPCTLEVCELRCFYNSKVTTSCMLGRTLFDLRKECMTGRAPQKQHGFFKFSTTRHSRRAEAASIYGNKCVNNCSKQLAFRSCMICIAFRCHVSRAPFHCGRNYWSWHNVNLHDLLFNSSAHSAGPYLNDCRKL